MKLSVKILLFIIITTVIIFSTTFGYIAIMSKEKAIEETQNLVDIYARENAYLIGMQLNKDMDLSRAMSHFFLSYDSIAVTEREKIFLHFLRTVYAENKEYKSIWASIELRMLDNEYMLEYGRKRINVFDSHSEGYTIETMNTEGDVEGSIYSEMKKQKGEFITTPYYFSQNPDIEKPELVTSICASITKNGKFLGLTGLDVGLDYFQKIINNIRPLDGTYAMLLSFDGTIVAHTDTSFRGKNIDSEFSNIEELQFFLNQIKKGNPMSFNLGSTDTNTSYVSFAPIQIGTTKTPWAIGLFTSKSEIDKIGEAISNKALIYGIFGIMILGLGTFVLTNYITKPLRRTTNLLYELSLGNVKGVNKLRITTKDEIGKIQDSANRLLEGLRNTADFASAIGEGRLETHFDLLSSRDILGTALLEMRKSLKIADKDNKLRQEEERRMSWANSGIALFSEVLRQNNDNIEEFSYGVISKLVEYVEANAGAFYLINDDDRQDVFIEIIATIAFNKRKFLNKRIEMNTELVGRCVQERQSIYLTDIPNNYVKIDSGLGESKPYVLLLVPLKQNDEIYGVIEIASFSDLEKYKIDFVEKIGINTASTIANVKNSIRTSKLLKDSQKKSEELVIQEEVMRRNLEELRKTQEEAGKNEAESRSFVDAVNHSIIRADIALNGALIYGNTRFLEIFGYTSSEIDGRHISMLFNGDDWLKFDSVWNKLIHGSPHFESNINHRTKNGNIWLFDTLTPMRNRAGEIKSILYLALNISEIKNMEENAQKMLNAAKRQIKTLSTEEEALKREVELLKKRITLLEQKI